MEFKDLLELYKQGKYLEVIQNADGVSDFNAKFLKVRSYYALDRFVEALNEYKNNEEILTKSNFAESIRLYVDILVKLNYDLPQILIQLGPYYDYPNLNLEVKDLLLNLEQYVRGRIKLEENSDVEPGDILYDDETLFGLLESKNPTDIFDALSYIRSMFGADDRIVIFVDKIREILKSRTVFDLTYAILFNQLVLVGDGDYYLFNKNGHYYNVSPLSLSHKLEESNKYLDKCLALLEKYERDIVIKECATRLLLMGYVYLTPEFLDNISSANEFFYASYLTTLKLLHKESSEIEKFNIKKINLNKVKIYEEVLKTVSREWNSFKI